MHSVIVASQSRNHRCRNAEDFRYLPRGRSEAAVKGSRGEPGSGRRPLTVKPSEGYVNEIDMVVLLDGTFRVAA